MRKTGDMDPDKFCDRLEKMNRMLQFFPPVSDDAANQVVFEDDELCDILDSAKKPEWHVIMMSQGMRPHSFDSFAQARVYYKQLWNAERRSLPSRRRRTRIRVPDRNSIPHIPRKVNSIPTEVNSKN